MEGSVLQPDLLTQRDNWMERWMKGWMKGLEILDNSSGKLSNESQADSVRREQKKVAVELTPAPQSSTSMPSLADGSNQAMIVSSGPPGPELTEKIVTTGESSGSSKTQADDWTCYCPRKKKEFSVEGFANLTEGQLPYFQSDIMMEGFENKHGDRRVDVKLGEMKFGVKVPCGDSGRKGPKVTVVKMVTMKVRPKFVDGTCDKLARSPPVTAKEITVTDSSVKGVHAGVPWAGALTYGRQESISCKDLTFYWLPALEEEGKCVVWRWRLDRCINGKELQDYKGTLDEDAIGFNPEEMIIDGRANKVSASWYFRPGFGQGPNVPPMTWEVEVIMSTVVQEKVSLLFKYLYFVDIGPEFCARKKDFTFDSREP